MTNPTTELAQKRIDDFERRHGPAVLRLAKYAALPVALNPDLLHLLRINFLLDEDNPPPYTAETDLLLSPLCREIDDGLYEMLPEVRDTLLRELASELHGTQHIQDVATLLWHYTRRSSPWANRPTLERAQELTALNFLDPSQAEAWLNEAESQAGPDAPLEREWFVAMRGEVVRGREAIHPPSTRAGGRRAFRSATVTVPRRKTGLASSQQDGGRQRLQVVRATQPKKTAQPLAQQPPTLREMLTTYFNLDELHTLCSEMNIDFETLPGDTIADKARELISYCKNHDRLSDLINLCKRLRPHVD